jgi:hypothetical protein
MNSKLLLVGGLLSIMTMGCATQAQQYGPPPQYDGPPQPYGNEGPVVNIGERHGNLRNAQINIVQAYHFVQMSQHDNHGQLGGHAQHAKDLLVQADAELRAAADVSNAEGN